MTKDELISAYFEGTLSDEARQKFDALLLTDTEFKAEFEDQAELQQTLRKTKRLETKAMLNDLYADIEKRKTKVIRLQPWLVAASIAVILGLGTWLFVFNTNSTFDNNQLYASYYEPYENVVHPIVRGNEIADLRTDAFMAYEEGDYNEALVLFEKLRKTQDDAYLDFYNAIILMQLERHQDANPLLKSYIDSDGELKSRAQWYLALSNLKLDNLNAAKENLENLIQTGGFKQEEAKELLEEIN